MFKTFYENLQRCVLIKILRQRNYFWWRRK